MKEQISNIIQQLESKGLDDPSKSVEFDELNNILRQDKHQTIGVLEELDQNAVEWISSYFEALSYQFKSKKFIDALKRLEIKFPDISFLKDDIQDAINAFEEEA